MPRFVSGLTVILLLLSFSARLENTFSHTSYNTFLQQSKPNYLVLDLGEVHSKTLDAMLHELNTYEDKISLAVYNYDNMHLTINYTNLISLDDILQIVSKYVKDFTKIAGTGIQ